MQLGVMQFWLPDSPRWLLLSGAGKSRAEKDLVRARGSTADPAAVQKELASIEKSVREAQAMESPGEIPAMLALLWCLTRCLAMAGNLDLLGAAGL